MKTSRIQETLFLEMAPAQEIYNFLKESYLAAESSWMSSKLLTDDLEEKMLKRNDDLINFGLASFSARAETLEKLFASKDKKLKIAVLSNQCAIGPLSTNILKENVKTICEDSELAAALISNHSFGGSELADLLLREDEFKFLTKERWLSLLEFALFSENIKPANTKDFGYDDGWGWYTANRPQSALSKVLLELNPAKDKRLVNLTLSRMTEIHSAVKNDDATNKLKYKHSILPTLLLLIEKYKDHPEFISEICGKVQKHDTDSFEFIRDNNDDAIRAGYYRMFTPTKASEVKKLYGKDGDLFVKAAVQNRNFFTVSKGMPTDVNTALQDIISNLDENSPSTKEIQREWDFRASALEAEDIAGNAEIANQDNAQYNHPQLDQLLLIAQANQKHIRWIGYGLVLLAIWLLSK